MYMEVIILLVVLIFGAISCAPLIPRPAALEPTTTLEIINPLPAGQSAFEAVRVTLTRVGEDQ